MSDDPRIGDRVILRGRIASIDEGVALVAVDRTFPTGICIPVQCGALEHDEQGVGGSPDGEAVIQRAVAEATANPGKTVVAGPEGSE